MRRTLTVAALVLALCCPAFAGIMHTPAPATPPPDAVQGEMTADGASKADSLTETVLSLLERVLALF